MILNVQVHLLQSDELDALNATLRVLDIETLFTGANRTWMRAGIRWNVESIVRERAENVERYKRALRGDSADLRQVMLSVLPREKLIGRAWNVIVLGDFGDIVGAAYLSSPDVQVIFFAEVGSAGAQDPTGSGPRVLAHP